MEKISLPIEDYHADVSSLSKTSISMLLDKPSSYYNLYLAPEREKTKDSSSMIIGSALHCLLLEEHEFQNRFLISKVKSRNSKIYKEERDTNPATTILTIDEYEKIQRMRDALYNHNGASVFLNSPGCPETSFFWNHHETKLKCRPDYITEDFCIDIKTTRDGSPKAFQKDADLYKYWLSAAMTLLGVEAVRGKKPKAYVFICVENKGEKHPEVSIYHATDEFVSLGEHYLLRGIEIYKDCKKRGRWPGYSRKSLPLDLLPFRQQELETLRFSGELKHA